MKNILIPIIVTFTFSLQSIAQKTGTDFGDEEITITKDRKIVLPPANRILEKIPSQSVVTIPDRKFNYNFNDYKPEGVKESKFTPNIINIESSKKQLEPSFSNLFRIGVGNYGRIFGETSLNSNPENPVRFGLHYLHNSSSIGPKDDFLSSSLKTGGSVYGNYNTDFFKLSSEVGVQHDRINFYGYEDALKPFIESTLTKREQKIERDRRIGQRMNRYNFEIGFENNIADSKFDYKLKSNVHLFNSKQYSLAAAAPNSKIGGFFPFIREIDWLSHLDAYFPIIDRNLVAKIEGEASILNIANDYDLLKTKNYSRNLYKIFPSFTYQNETISATIGFRGVSQYEGLTATSYSKGYPVANFTYKTASGLSFFTGLDGDFNRNTLWNLTEEMPFLYNNTEVFNTEKPLEVYLGSKGEIINGITYNLRGSFNQFKNLFFFNNNASIYEKFDLIYEKEKSNVYTFNGEINYPISENFKTGLNLTYNYYDLKTLEKPFHRPAFIGKWTNTAYFSDKLLATTTLFFRGNSFAKNPISTDIVKISSIFDFNIELDYLFGKQFSGFVKLNNIFNQNYEQYLFYQKQGFNFLCGINYIF